MKVRLASLPSFSVIWISLTLIVVAGLIWLTMYALDMEKKQLESDRLVKVADKTRLALWRLDSYVLPYVSQENNRPYSHYTALTPTPNPAQPAIIPMPGPEVEWSPMSTDLRLSFTPSPLLNQKQLPAWMKLHLQLDAQQGWSSPQVIPEELVKTLKRENLGLPLIELNDCHVKNFEILKKRFPAEHAVRTLQDFQALETQTTLQRSLTSPVIVKTPPLPSVISLLGVEKPVENAPTKFQAPAPAGVVRAFLNQFERSQLSLGENKQQVVSKLFAHQDSDPWITSKQADALRVAYAFQLTSPAAPSIARIWPEDRVDQNITEINESLVKEPIKVSIVRVQESSDRYSIDTQCRAELAQKALLISMPEARSFVTFNPKQTEHYLKLGLKQYIQTNPKISASEARHRYYVNIASQVSQYIKEQELYQFSLRWRAQELGNPLLLPPEAHTHLTSMEKTTTPEPNLNHWLGPIQPKPGWLNQSTIHVNPLRPQWFMDGDYIMSLFLIRTVQTPQGQTYQGVLLDWQKLKDELKQQIADLFPEAEFVPPIFCEPKSLDQTMTSLPISLVTHDQGEQATPGWTTLRLGLVLVWLATILVMLAFWFGGQVLLNHSERRVRFASAISHELRSPLTSFKLYLDMMSSGMIRDPQQQQQYLDTLIDESNRLNLIVDNVLDFARLEKRGTTTNIQLTSVQELADLIHETWNKRLENDGFQLETDSRLPMDRLIHTDQRIVVQILSNLIDNARKYARSALDHRVIVRWELVDDDRLSIAVMDFGPGVTKKDRWSIFRPFRRGHNVLDTGGAGLGLSLSQQWATLLGGHLRYTPGESGGACFRLEIPTTYPE